MYSVCQIIPEFSSVPSFYILFENKIWKLFLLDVYQDILSLGLNQALFKFQKINSSFNVNTIYATAPLPRNIWGQGLKGECLRVWFTFWKHKEDNRNHFCCQSFTSVIDF